MSLRGLGLAAAAAAAGLLAGCSAQRPAPRPPVVVEPEPAALSPGTYLAVSGSRSLLLVRASEVAEARAPGTAGMARRIAADHRGIAAQLSLAGRRLNLLPAAALLPTDAAQLDALRRAEDVGTAYRRIVAAAVENCIRHDGDYAVRGTSPSLRPVARFAEAVCREELAALR